MANGTIKSGSSVETIAETTHLTNGLLFRGGKARTLDLNLRNGVQYAPNLGYTIYTLPLGDRPKENLQIDGCLYQGLVFRAVIEAQTGFVIVYFNSNATVTITNSAITLSFIAA